MEGLDFNDERLVEREKASPRGKNSKGKWREIEAIKDRLRLQKELEALDVGFNPELDFEY